MKMNMVNRCAAVIFTYGTLKRGFSNHGCLEGLISSGDASFLGDYRTSVNFPLVCGPYRVPFLLNFPGAGHHRVSGELYAVSSHALARLDDLEGTHRGHYERLPITVEPILSSAADQGVLQVLQVEAYYAHSSYAEELWRRNGQRGYSSYTHKVARGYIRRKDRPPHLSFLDHIRIFLSSDTDTANANAAGEDDPSHLDVDDDDDQVQNNNNKLLLKTTFINNSGLKMIESTTVHPVA